MSDGLTSVSVIIPVYNVEKYLARCIDSVLEQTVKDIEVILIDDGSTDKSSVICDQYALADPRINVIHKDNGGLASARNAGLHIAKGKYVFFLDSDDWLERDGLKILYDKGEEYNVDFVRFRPFRSGLPGKAEHVPARLEKVRELSEGYYNKDRIISEVYPRLLATSHLTMGAIVGVWESLYRRDFLNKNGLFFHEEIRYSEDLIFSAELVRAADSFYYIDSPCVYHYYYNPESISRSFRENRWDSCKETVRVAKLKFKTDNEYDFSDQLNYLEWFCVLSALNERKYLKTNPEKARYCKTVLNDEVLDSYRLSFKKLHVSLKQTLILLLVRFKLCRILALI